MHRWPRAGIFSPAARGMTVAEWFRKENPMSHIANTIKMLTVALSLSSLVGLVGCEGAPDGGVPQEETTTAALSRGSGAAGSFTCDDGAGTCTCVGDDECNEMFGSGLCGPVASCDTSNPLRPVCTCKQAMRVVPPKVGSTIIGKAATVSLAR
jgi:hypothetical protein